MDKKIGFIGAGNMATAIINGLLKNNVVAPENINVFDVNENQLKLMAEKGVTTCDTSTKVVTDSNIIVLAVKPQNYEEVLNGVKDSVSEEKIFVSIAAGISISYVQKALECNCPMVRVMPNTPLLLGKGATALCPSDNISEEKTFEREVAQLLQIKDAYPKYVIARTRHDEYQYEGIKVIDIADWLLDK